MQESDFRTMCDRQHRQTGTRVIITTIHRQCPEMRRCPDKDDQHQQPCLHWHIISDCRPTQRRWHCSCQTTNHDILRRGWLQDDGVNDRIANKGHKREPHSERIDHRVENPHPCPTNHARKYQRLQGTDLALCCCATGRTCHPGINFSLHQTIDCKCSTS